MQQGQAAPAEKAAHACMQGSCRNSTQACTPSSHRDHAQDSNQLKAFAQVEADKLEEACGIAALEDCALVDDMEESQHPYPKVARREGKRGVSSRSGGARSGYSKVGGSRA